MRIGDDDKETNLRKAEELIDGVQNADLILLPELWAIGYYSFDLYASAGESLDGEIAARMKGKARQKGCFIFAGSLLERSDEQIYNTSVLIDPEGEIVGKYRKIHLYGHNSSENKLLQRGTDIVVVETKMACFGLSTCYDLRFPELYRKLALQGANVFLVASAWPYPRLEHWLMLNRVRALENQVFLISSNCVGTNRQKQFLGHSMVINPWGTIVTSGGDLECILQAEIDVKMVEEARAMFPAFTDRVLEV